MHVETPPAIPLAAALDLWDREARRGVCDTGRYRMPYFVWGSGPPLVFVHGLADTSRAFIPVMAALRRQFTCIAYDLPAGGADGARLGAYRHRHLVADLFALLDHLGFRQAHLFGSSFGSTIVLAALHAHPDWTTRAVLQGGFAYRPLARWERRPVRVRPLLAGAAGDAAAAGATGSPVRHAGLPATAGRVPVPPDQQRRAAEGGRRPPRADVLDVDLRPQLPAIRQPVLMICGDCDRDRAGGVRAAAAGGAAERGAGRVAGCGHYPQYTHAPLVAEVVRQFLAAPAAGCRVAACGSANSGSEAVTPPRNAFGFALNFSNRSFGSRNTSPGDLLLWA